MGYPGARQQRCRHAPSGLRQSPLQVSEPRTPYVLSLCSPLPNQAAWSRGGGLFQPWVPRLACCWDTHRAELVSPQGAHLWGACRVQHGGAGFLGPGTVPLALPTPRSVSPSLSWGFDFSSEVAPVQALWFHGSVSQGRSQVAVCLPEPGFMNDTKSPGPGCRGRGVGAGAPRPGLPSPWETDRQTDPLCMLDKSLWVLCSGDSAATTRHRPSRRSGRSLPGPGSSRTGGRLLPGGSGPRPTPDGQGETAGPRPGLAAGIRGGAAGVLSPGGREALGVWTGVDRRGQQMGPAWGRGAVGPGQWFGEHRTAC